MMYGAGEPINSSPKRICNSPRTLHGRKLPSIEKRSIKKNTERHLTKASTKSKRTLKTRNTILATIILFWISIPIIQVSCSSATFQDDKVAIIVSYKLGQWIIIAKNGTKITETFNVTSYSLIPVSINNRTLKWGETIVCKAEPNKLIELKIEYQNKTVKLIFNVIKAKEAEKEMRKELLTMSIKDLLSLKSRYFIIGAVVGIISIFNAYLIKRRALLLDIKSSLGLIAIFVIIALFTNMAVSSKYNEPEYYWIVYMITLAIGVGVIPPPKGIYILEPQLSKRNVNLEYFAVYKDREGIPRVAEQSTIAALKRLLGLGKDPVLVDGLTKETLSLAPDWTLNYEDPLIIAMKVDYKDVKLEDSEEKEVGCVITRAWCTDYANMEFLVKAKTFEEMQEKYAKTNSRLLRLEIAKIFETEKRAAEVWSSALEGLSPEIKEKLLKEVRK